MGSSSEKQPKGNVLKKTVKFARVPMAAAMLAGCGIVGMATDSGIPKCDKDPQPITKTVTLFPDSNTLSVEGNFINAEHPGEIDIIPRQLISPSNLKHHDDAHWSFQGTNIKDRPTRYYSVTATPDTNPDNIGRNGTVVTIQADCETPQTNP